MAHHLPPGLPLLVRPAPCEKADKTGQIRAWKRESSGVSPLDSWKPESLDPRTLDPGNLAASGPRAANPEIAAISGQSLVT